MSLARTLFALPLAAALFPAAPAHAGTCGQTAFFATFGDNTQVDDGAVTVDDPAAPLYGIPALYLSNAAVWWGNGVARSDELVVDAAYPGVLAGYSAFAPSQVESAFLRFDFYYTQYSNTEGFAVMEETTFAATSFNFAYYDKLRERLRRMGMDREQWISVRIDLMTGNAFAQRIDSYGNPTYDYGHFTTFGAHAWDSGSLGAVLSLASDGDLYTLFYDDMTLSYVAFYGITQGWGC